MKKKFGNHISLLLADQEGAPETKYSEVSKFSALPPRPVVAFDLKRLQHVSRYSKKEVRSYSKQTLMALEVMHDLDLSSKVSLFEKLRCSIYAVGFIERLHAHCCNVYLGGSSIYQSVRSCISPTYFLKYDMGIMPGHLSIHFGIQGPSASFSGRYGLVHALEKAKMDIDLGLVDLGVVVAVSSYEEPLATLAHADHANERILLEGAVCVLLERDNTFNEEFEVHEESDLGYLEPMKYLWKKIFREVNRDCNRYGCRGFDSIRIRA